MAVWTAGWANV